MNRFCLPSNFWTNRTWKPWLIILCFFGELPWVLLMDYSRAIKREIHGWNTLRINFARLMDNDVYSSNIFGWMADLDKIVPYTATLVAFIILGRLLRGPKQASGSELNQAKQSNKIFPLWVSLWGVAGAALISFHYLTSRSGHYTSYLDKGLIDAFEHLGDGEGVFWSALIFYRLTYLLLSPCVYFIMFSTSAAAATLATREASLYTPHQEEGRLHSQRAFFYLLVAGLPPFLLFSLHQVANASFKFGNYEPTGVRLRILAALYGLFLSTFLVVWLRLRQRGYRLRQESLSRVFKGLEGLKSAAGTLGWLFNFILIFPIPIAVIDMGSSDLNSAINGAANIYVYSEDYSHFPQALQEFDSQLNRLLFGSPPSRIIEQMWDHSGSEARAFMLSTAALLKVGLKPKDIVDLEGAARSREDSSRVCSKVVSDRRSELIQRFPVYTSDEAGCAGKKKFGNALKKVCGVWSRVHNSVLKRREENYLRQYLSDFEKEYLSGFESWR